MHMLVSMYYCIYMFSYGPYGPEIKHYYYYYYYRPVSLTSVFFEEITKWVDEGSPVDLFGFPESAFDKVPHQRLIFKLKPHGMGNSIINWIEQWLNDRSQRVVVGGEVSS